MEYDYDVIVVGGRVAGASTAMLLARQGHRVLMVDRVELPADTVSTHTILRTGVLQLTRWGLLEQIKAAGTPPIGEVVLGFGQERIPVEMNDDYGIPNLYAPRRFVLDAVLLDAARESGVEFSGGTRVSGMARDAAGRVTAVTMDPGFGDIEMTCRVVVGADGVKSRIAEMVGARAMVSHPPLNAIHYAYYTGVESPGCWFQFTPGLMSGLISTNDGEACVFAGRPASQLGPFRSDPEAEFLRLLRASGADLADRVQCGKRVSPFRGTNGLPGFMRQPWGPGWALVGDAGCTMDPISAHGISNALLDAELCSRAIDQSLRDPSGESEVMARYQRLRDALELPLYRESTALAGYGWDAHEASTRMRAISEAVRTECEAISSLPEWPGLLSAA